MIDKVKFMETLRAVAEIARVSTIPLTKEEINGYFDQMELSEEQQEMVYQYLLNPQTEQVDEEPKEEKPADDSQSDEQTEEQTEEEKHPVMDEEESKYLRMYLEELEGIEGLSMPEEREAYMKLIDGDETVIQDISDHWLNQVVEIAKTYSKHNVNFEDLIQEGNIGLVMGLNSLLGTKQIIDVKEYIKESVQKAMEDYIDEMSTENDWESTVLAKTTLIHEAMKALKEELGRTPTVTDLSNYTKISEEEIRDILHLSLEDKEIKASEIEPWDMKME